MDSPDPRIPDEAVNAAGTWELDAAWPRVVALVKASTTPKHLLLAAIEAVGNIRPQEAEGILLDLADSCDKEIAEAAGEAIAMARAMSREADEDEEEKDEDEDWINCPIR